MPTIVIKNYSILILDLIGSMFAALVFAFIYETMKSGIAYYYSKPASSLGNKTENEEQTPLVSHEYATAIRHTGM